MKSWSFIVFLFIISFSYHTVLHNEEKKNETVGTSSQNSSKTLKIKGLYNLSLDFFNDMIIQPIFSGYEFVSYNAKSLTDKYMKFSQDGPLLEPASHHRWNFKEMLLAIVIRFCLGWLQSKLFYYNAMNELYSDINKKVLENKTIQSFLQDINSISISIYDDNSIIIDNGIPEDLNKEYVENILSQINKELHKKNNWYTNYSSSAYTYGLKGLYNIIKKPFIWSFNLISAFIKNDFFNMIITTLKNKLNANNAIKDNELDSKKKLFPYHVTQHDFFLNKNNSDFALKILTIEYTKIILFSELKKIFNYMQKNNEFTITNKDNYKILTTQYNDPFNATNNNSELENSLEVMRNNFRQKQNNNLNNNNDDEVTNYHYNQKKNNENFNDDVTTEVSYNTEQKKINNSNATEYTNNNEELNVTLHNLAISLNNTINNLNILLEIVAIMHDSGIKFDPKGQTDDFVFIRSLLFKLTQVLMTLFDTGFVLNVIAYVTPQILPQKEITVEKIKYDKKTKTLNSKNVKKLHNFFLPSRDNWDEKKQEKFKNKGTFHDIGFWEKHWGKAALGSIGTWASQRAYEKLIGNKSKLDEIKTTLSNNSSTEIDQQNVTQIEESIITLLKHMQQKDSSNTNGLNIAAATTVKIFNGLKSKIKEKALSKSAAQEILTLLINDKNKNNSTTENNNILSVIAQKLIA